MNLKKTEFDKTAKILVVDDQPENLFAMEAMLKDAGTQVFKAESGKEALSMMLHHNFAMVFLDVKMPEMDGFELAKLIRGNDKTKNIPIIFLSAYSKEDQFIYKGYEAGAVDYILKPFNNDVVKQKAKVFLEINHQKALLEQTTLELSETNKKLQEAKDELELRIKERTQELTIANKNLNQEIIKYQQAEKALRKSSELLNATQQLSKVGGWEFDIVTGKSIWTEELYRIHEISADPGIGLIEESLKCYGSKDKTILYNAFRNAVEKGETYDLELPFTTFKGQSRWIRTTGQPVYEEDKIVRVIGNLMDITERKQAEESLRESEERFRRLAENARDIIYRMSLPDGKYEYVSPAAYSIFGYYPEEFYANPSLFHQAIHPDWHKYFEEQWINLLKGEMPPTYEYQIIHKSGEIRWLNQRNILVCEENGIPIAIEGIVTDITERKQAEEEIRTLYLELEQRVIDRTARLEATNKELESLTYSLAHDLRTPLRAIDGFGHALLEEYQDKVDAQGKDYLHRVRSATQRIGQIIDDILSLSSVSRGEMNIQEVNLSQMVQKIADEIHSIQPEREVRFIIQEGIKVQGDARLLHTVFENLIGNAWKFTSKHPTALIEFGMQQQNDIATYFIRDDGAGFDMNYAQKLFGAFQRLHTITEFPGTGVGLATVQRVIHRHGGNVWAKSEVEKGTTIYFTIA